MVQPAVMTLTDTFSRTHRSLRISITDKCQLRCTYCMPADGLPWLPRADHLSVEEIVRVAKVAYSAGVREFRLTGGEPLIRPEAIEIVRRLAQIPGDGPSVDISLTTNAVMLKRFAGPLKDAGLSRVNVSVDTLDEERFVNLTLRDCLSDVLEGLEAAKDAGLSPIKINTLLMPGVNSDEVLSLTDFAVRNGFELRFIEQMPLGDAPWDGSNIITQQQILDTLAARYELTEVPGRGSAPAAKWYLDGGPATVGIIASVTRPFCADCDRLRLTADGQIRTCLFSDAETDLRGPLRAGATDQQLLELLQGATLSKGAGHLIGKSDFVVPDRGMSRIGG